MPKTLSIQQPWSYCITNGTKRVEYRSWRSDYRGLLLLHAGKTFQDGMEYAIAADSPEMDITEMQNSPRGGLVGVAFMVACVREHEVAADQRIWAGGPWCFVLDKPQPFLSPIPYRGERGLFDVPDSVVREALLQIGISLPKRASSAPDHHCHAIGCEASVPPRLFMCPPHWRRLPKKHQNAINREYVRGQEITKTPTLAYLVVQAEAVLRMAELDGVDDLRLTVQRARAAGLREELSASEATRIGADLQQSFSLI